MQRLVSTPPICTPTSRSSLLCVFDQASPMSSCIMFCVHLVARSCCPSGGPRQCKQAQMKSEIKATRRRKERRRTLRSALFCLLAATVK